MPNPVVLNNEAHRRLRIITARGAAYGEAVNFVPVIANELRGLAVNYPVCLMKDPETGQFGLFALLGFEAGENLFLRGRRWSASYIPMHVRRQPFMAGFSANEHTDGASPKAVILIDMDSKRVQESEGEALFAEDGGYSPYLRNISALLSSLVAGMESTKTFIDALSAHDLIEALQLNITLASGEQKSYDGIYTVNEESLGELSGIQLEQLHKKGYLQASHLMLASMGNIQKLIDLKNRRRENRKS
ncbi:MAG: SapC protein [Alphaproteobacteria bacterium]|nr:MAG: SapC protein [Alphaproteobacteria bacterium]